MRSSGTRKMPCEMAWRGLSMLNCLAVEATEPASKRIDAEYGARQFGAPRADQAGKAEDLALPAR